MTAPPVSVAEAIERATAVAETVAEPLVARTNSGEAGLPLHVYPLAGTAEAHLTVEQGAVARC
jgi:hypothetical protein